MPRPPAKTPRRPSQAPRAEPANPRAWAQAKIAAFKERGLWRGSLERSAPGWDAHVAQRAVVIYKARGHGYRAGPARAATSLRRWTREDWGYGAPSKAGALSKPGASRGRYLPRAVRAALPPALRKLEDERKAECERRGQKHCPYDPRTVAVMRRLGVLRRGKREKKPRA